MECNECRKKLEAYSKNKIKDKIFVKEMEKHIKHCNICKRELLLWQDLIQKQSELNNIKTDARFSERIRKRMNNFDNEADMPRITRQMKALNKFVSSPKGCLLIQIFLVLAGFLFVFFVVKKGTNIILPTIAILAFGSAFFLLWKNGKKK